MKKIEKDFILKDFDHVNNEITIKMEKLNSIISLFMEEEINIIEEGIKEKNKEKFEQQQKVVIDDDNDVTDNQTNDSEQEQEKYENNNEIVENQDNNADELPSDIKTIYRKIVMITHPDKNKDNYKYELYTDFYKRSVKAKDSNDISEIIFIAYKLNINEVYDIDDEYFVNLKSKLTEIKNKSNTIDMNSFWVWYHTDNKKLKRMMVEQISKLR